ncbi:putative amine oxidase [copper-containing] isoform X2 [Octopus sinensis]|nr:putative amine oxidase [copper-containing] isoform X2 [Octopus sinensis]
MALSHTLKFWRTISYVLIAVSLSLLIAVIVISSERNCYPSEKKPTESMIEKAEWYNELLPNEIELVVKFLEERSNLSIVTAKKALLSDSFIHFIELKMPDKKNILRYLNEETYLPNREAKAVIFRGNEPIPCVEEYVIGPLSNITYMHKIRTIPFYQRPITVMEMKNLKLYIIKKVEDKTRDFLLKEYDALPISCIAHCLEFYMSPVPEVLGKFKRRLLWLGFSYKTIYDISPVNFQFEADITSPTPSDWTVGKAWFDNKMYDNLTHLIQDYNKTYNENTTRFYQRTVFQEKRFSNFHKYEQKEESSGGSDSKKSYTILKQSTIHYFNWKFHFHITPSVGLRILNIRYWNEQIVYEMSLQEIAVLYSGFSPAGILLNFIDGTALFGTRSKGLIAGVDCPNHATFLSPYIYSSNDGGMKKMENALCVFDQSTMVPLSRHKFTTMHGTFFDALLDKILVLRTVVTFLSYDYIIDYLFHKNGAIEVQIHSTGKLLVTSYSPNKGAYGVQISKTTIANIHNHLFHYKVDLDVKGTENRFETWNLQQYPTHVPWDRLIKNNNHIQTRLTRVLIETETNATFDYESSSPKYLLFYNKLSNNEFGNPRSYRVIINDVSNLLLPRDYGFARTVSWAYHHMSVTSRKETEERSSSIYGLWDNGDQVVNFANFSDGESICDKDLVAWITLGFHHIPQLENIPSTNTLGTKVSFLLMPFNYFDKDPLASEKDRYFFPVDD